MWVVLGSVWLLYFVGREFILLKLRSCSLSREIGLIGDARIIEAGDFESHRIKGFLPLLQLAKL